MEKISDLHGGLKRIAIVSGATGGMGSAICSRLACDGIHVVMMGRDQTKLEQVRARLLKENEIGEYLSIQVADIGNQNSVCQAIEAITERYEKLDILVHAAGDGPVAPLMETNEAMWQETLQGKLLGTIRLTRAVAEQMIRYKSGTIIIVNGVFSREPDPLFPINSTVNAGLSGFGKAIARDLGRYGIRVNIVNPGATATPLWDKICSELASRFDTTADEINQQVLDKIPLGTLALPDDIANVIAFLASSNAHYLNGTSISIDGGASVAI